MFNNNTINPFLDQIVFTIDSMCEKKDIPQELVDYLYLVCSGMILYYGLDYTKEIYQSINDTKYIYGLKDLETKLTPAEYNRIKNKINYRENAYAISQVNSTYINDKVNKILNITYTLLIARNTPNKEELLEFITHELNHILSSINNTFTYTEDSIYFRYGLFKTKIGKDNDETGRILNEIINTLQTEDIIKIIIDLKKYKINNPKFNNALNSIITTLDSKKYVASGYETFVNLYRPLFSNQEFKSTINKCILDGNIEDLEKKINTQLGNHSYTRMNLLLDSLYQSFEDTRNINIHKAYQTSVLYTTLKDKYIYELLGIKPMLRYN